MKSSRADTLARGRDTTVLIDRRAERLLKCCPRWVALTGRGTADQRLDRRVQRVSGRKTVPWRDVVPSDLAGVRVVEPMRLVKNGTAYVSSFRRVLSDLYLVEGLK